MQWIQGGDWEVRGSLAVLPALGGADSAHRDEWDRSAMRGELRVAARNFWSEPEEWENHIGRIARLRRYQPEVEPLLESIKEFAEKFPRAVGVLPVGTGGPSDEEAQELLNFVRLHGPLSPVGLVVEAPLAMRAGYPERAVLLNDLADALRLLARAAELLSLPPEQRTRLDAAQIQSWGQSFLLHVEPVPSVVVAKGGTLQLTYEVRSASLGNYLWREIVWRLGRLGTGVCRYCTAPFEEIPHRGRPRLYCPKHRASRYRKSVSRGTAPASWARPTTLS